MNPFRLSDRALDRLIYLLLFITCVLAMAAAFWAGNLLATLSPLTRTHQ